METNKMIAGNTPKAALPTGATAQTVANISPDLCAPMSGIMEMSTLLLATDLTENQRQLVQTINSCGHNLRAIIENAIHSTKPDEKEFELRPAPFDLRALLHGLVLKQIPAARLARINIDINYPEHLPKNFIGDAARLEQVLSLLLKNALKRAQEDSITLFVNGQLDAQDEFHLYLAVKDNGAAIEKKDLPSLFNEVSSNISLHGNICLSMSKKIIEHMGGTLKVVSENGQGAVFYINIALPIVKSAQSVPTFQSIAH